MESNKETMKKEAEEEVKEKTVKEENDDGDDNGTHITVKEEPVDVYEPNHAVEQAEVKQEVKDDEPSPFTYQHVDSATKINAEPVVKMEVMDADDTQVTVKLEPLDAYETVGQSEIKQEGEPSSSTYYNVPSATTSAIAVKTETIEMEEKVNADEVQESGTRKVIYAGHSVVKREPLDETTVNEAPQWNTDQHVDSATKIKAEPIVKKEVVDASNVPMTKDGVTVKEETEEVEQETLCYDQPDNQREEMIEGDEQCITAHTKSANLVDDKSSIPAVQMPTQNPYRARVAEKCDAIKARAVDEKGDVATTSNISVDVVKTVGSPSCQKKKATKKAAGKTGKATHPMKRRSTVSVDEEMIDEPQMLTRAQRQKWLRDAGKKKEGKDEQDEKDE